MEGKVSIGKKRKKKKRHSLKPTPKRETGGQSFSQIPKLEQPLAPERTGQRRARLRCAGPWHGAHAQVGTSTPAWEEHEAHIGAGAGPMPPFEQTGRTNCLGPRFKWRWGNTQAEGVSSQKWQRAIALFLCCTQNCTFL